MPLRSLTFTKTGTKNLNVSSLQDSTPLILHYNISSLVYVHLLVGHLNPNPQHSDSSVSSAVTISNRHSFIPHGGERTVWAQLTYYPKYRCLKDRSWKIKGVCLGLSPSRVLTGNPARILQYPSLFLWVSALRWFFKSDAYSVGGIDWMLIIITGEKLYRTNTQLFVFPTVTTRLTNVCFSTPHTGIGSAPTWQSGRQQTSSLRSYRAASSVTGLASSICLLLVSSLDLDTSWSVFEGVKGLVELMSHRWHKAL